MNGRDERPAYEASTRGVRVRVRPRYLPDRSEPSERRWLFAYEVEIHNGSSDVLTVVDRRWRITDAFGRIEVVEGPGVVGETPTLRPGEAFVYVSACPLRTSSGSMVGSYGVVDAAGRRAEIDIPAFSLDAPAPRTLN